MAERAGELLTRAGAALAEAAYRTGDFDSVDGLLRKALALAEADGDLTSQAAALDLQGQLRHSRTIDLPPEEWQSVDPAPEQELFERALAIRRQIRDQAGVAESLLHLGWVHQVLRGVADVSMPMFREALALVEPDGDVHVRSELHRHIGFHLVVEDRRPEKALPHFETSLELWRSLGEPAREVFGLVALARCESDAGRHREALAHSREALELARQGLFRARVVTAAESTWRMVEDAARR
ncbi:MAG: tetratricopeptide repeat protein [Candidatus Dormibacteraeota bacterium]|nr:tetratricopeptide repeat protein [Candidatus Dormibacteraeota bacterium]